MLYVTKPFGENVGHPNVPGMLTGLSWRAWHDHVTFVQNLIYVHVK